MIKKNPYKLQAIPFITIVLSVILLLFLSYLANGKLNAQEDELEKESAMAAFTKLQETAEAEHPDLNHNYSIWIEEITYLRDNLEDDCPELFSFISAKEWCDQLDNITKAIKTSYISDDDIASEIDQIIPAVCKDTAYSKYMQSFELYISPGLFTSKLK